VSAVLGESGDPAAVDVADHGWEFVGGRLRPGLGGYAAFTMDALVERTGVSKTTMYKHWPSRTGLIAATVQALTAEPAVPDTGNVRDDLIALALDSIGAYKGALWPVLASLLEAAGHDAELRDALQSVSATRFAAVRSI
jgi:AcrR family transcriptional regulator